MRPPPGLLLGLVQSKHPVQQWIHNDCCNINCYQDKSHSHGDPTSLAPHERLTDLAVAPHEKPHPGAAAREPPIPAKFQSALLKKCWCDGLAFSHLTSGPRGWLFLGLPCSLYEERATSTAPPISTSTVPAGARLDGWALNNYPPTLLIW